jgi:hypothetical protein
VFEAALVVAAVSTVLLFVVFPWAEQHLPPNPLTGSGAVAR